MQYAALASPTAAYVAHAHWTARQRGTAAVYGAAFVVAAACTVTAPLLPDVYWLVVAALVFSAVAAATTMMLRVRGERRWWLAVALGVSGAVHGALAFLVARALLLQSLTKHGAVFCIACYATVAFYLAWTAAVCVLVAARCHWRVCMSGARALMRAVRAPRHY